MALTSTLPVSDVFGVLTEENLAVQDALKVARKQLGAMRDIANALAGQFGVDQVLQVIVGRVSALLDCERATLFIVYSAQRELISRATSEAGEPIRVPIGSGIVGRVAESGEVVNILDASDDPRFVAQLDERVAGARTRSLLAMPLRTPAGVIIGVLEARDRRVGPFSVEDERLLEAINSQISVALENAFLFEQLRRHVSELDLLSSLEQSMSSVTTEDELLDVVVPRIQKLIGAHAASIALIDQRTTVLRCRVAVAGAHMVTTSLPMQTGLISEAMATEATLRLEDAPADGRYTSLLARDVGFVPGPLIVVPLVFEFAGASTDTAVRRRYGAMTAMRARGTTPFSDDDERALSLVAQRIAASVHETRRREQSKNAQQLERIGTMLAGIVHDLKTPMTVIAGYAQLMAAEEDAKERNDNANVIIQHCDQMSSMIQELLQYVRGESTLLLRKVHVQQLINDVAETARRLVAKNPGVRVEVRANFKGSVRVDDGKLKRALSNLCKNALEAMGTAGTLTIGSDQSGNDVELFVSDTGPGIPPELEGRLFEQFATHGKKEGTGLGLAVVKKVVDDHGGTIVVESVPGQGTTFRVRVPISVRTMT